MPILEITETELTVLEVLIGRAIGSSELPEYDAELQSLKEKIEDA